MFKPNMGRGNNRDNRDNRDNREHIDRERDGERPRRRERDMDYEDYPPTTDRSRDEEYDDHTYDTGYHAEYGTGGDGMYEGYPNEVCLE
jgi:hypothetical protein